MLILRFDHPFFPTALVSETALVPKHLKRLTQSRTDTVLYVKDSQLLVFPRQKQKWYRFPKEFLSINQLIY